MTEYDYQLAWGIYIVSALGCLFAWFYFTGWMWRYVREPLRVLVAVLLFTPTVVDPARDFYAPAIAMTVMDLLFKVSNDAWRSVADLVMYGTMAFAAYVAFVVLRRLIMRNKRSAQRAGAEKQRPETLVTTLSEPAVGGENSQSGLIAQR